LTKNSDEPKYYVYTLAYPESMGGAVFYVGKGSGYRITNHEQQARRGVSSRKCEIIRQIWTNGEEVVKTIIKDQLTEDKSLALEIELLRQYGKSTLANERFDHVDTSPVDENRIREDRKRERERARKSKQINQMTFGSIEFWLAQYKDWERERNGELADDPKDRTRYMGAYMRKVKKQLREEWGMTRTSRDAQTPPRTI
jgi:hypothetical protein